MLKDATGRQYNIGDYVVCAVIGKNSSVTPFIGKVCRVGKALTVVRKDLSKKVLSKPEHHVIISEEVASACVPELLDYKVSEEVYVHHDSIGVEYKVGDYVFCAVHFSTSSVRTYFAKVVKINPCSVTVTIYFPPFSWRQNKFLTTVLMVPERHLIVPDEIAFRGCPELREL